MAFSLMKQAAWLSLRNRGVAAMMSRTRSTAASRGDISDLSPEDREKFYPKIGNRDIVGFGLNGQAMYYDTPMFPGQAIRFKENTPELLALREKEQGDWKNLTLEQKKELYRASYCQTYAEMYAPTGEWKVVAAIVLMAISVSGWCMIFLQKFVYGEKPRTITREWQEADLRKQIVERQGPIDGVASSFDYDNNKWK